MGYKKISLKLPTDFTPEQLKKKISKELNIQDFTYSIENKSLDARKRSNIHWVVTVSINSEEIKGEKPDQIPELNISYKKRDEKAIVVGSGPAGFFAAYALQKVGFNTTIIERGTDVEKRTHGIDNFEKTGQFDSKSNYSFGEGGAGTFSDGKLTSRSKHISQERKFILSSYVNAGAPEEILYMAHPHVGSDNLKVIVKNLRKEFIEIGGKILFETTLENIEVKDGKVTAALTNKGDFETNLFLIAPGHSAYETYRMLIKHGVQFRTKNFALGSRVEHPQEIINQAQWGQKRIPGIKAAEYRLTSNVNGKLPVYTFCMCPGGMIVPASAYDNLNIVNGMSLYQRNAKFANAGCVAGVNLEKLLGKEISALEALDWLENLEKSFYEYSDGFKAPYCSIQGFINKKTPSRSTESSYPLGLLPAPLWDLLPKDISSSMRESLKEFSRKIRGFETGNIMGLESKTSSPIQVLREKNGLCEGFKNLYLIGEGSGYAGGIISSAADGLKAAMSIINN
ncbi:MAG: NAD(P)-binding protein [Bacteroidales bacterium]|nr:NAD(P)-binding protein [Bacteroidales bacterium]